MRLRNREGDGFKHACRRPMVYIGICCRDVLMSLVFRTICSFPRGRTLEELHALIGTTFGHAERLSVISELEGLAADGKVRRLSDGKWIALVSEPLAEVVRGDSRRTDVLQQADVLIAAPFQRSTVIAPALDEAETAGETNVDPRALLRYWRSALRADPRGATTEMADRHGKVWHLVAGSGPLLPASGSSITLTIALDTLAPDFRAALLRRAANETTLALGWPLAVGRQSGVPVVWPIGLIAAEWRRDATQLEITVAADDILVNPDWIKGAARLTGWRSHDLKDIFSRDDGVGLESADFLPKLRDAAAATLRGHLTGDRLAGELNMGSLGIFDAAALFLPEDSSFTAGAVRDLDQIAAWPESVLARTALAPLVGLTPEIPPVAAPAINVGPLNGEQINAVRWACARPLTVVTGPPGTGKSQTIVSMAASELCAGGSVLVASKNHQALDAVEDRLGRIAPDAPFIVRTLDPRRDLDRSFQSVLGDLITASDRARPAADPLLVGRLQAAAHSRAADLESAERRVALECAIADALDGLARHGDLPPTQSEQRPVKRRFWRRLRAMFNGSARRDDPEPQLAETLDKRLARLRQERDTLAPPGDICQQTFAIADLTQQMLPVILASRTALSEDRREQLDLAKADLDFAGGKAALTRDMAAGVIAHRPLWLVSVLGAPRRLPLEDGLFDLVIFDEASQCDVASALPLFARAKRAVVVGDNRQLSFIPQLGQAQDRNLMQAQGLPVARMGRFAQSRQSLFDFARRVPGAHPIQLRQQYRSAGPIVDYINENFYGDTLKTAYDPAALRPPQGQKPGLAWTDVPAPLSPGSDNVNPAEVAAIVDHLVTLLMTQGYAGSVGVTSPFRTQAHAIEIAVQARIPAPVLEAAAFRAATVDGFQGQERDVMLFSPTLGASSRASAVAFVQKDSRRLNVAISRARAVAHVFGDLRYAQSGAVKTFAKLASAATEPKRKPGSAVFDSHWERIVYHALVARGLSPQPQYDIAGRRLDFALFGANGIKLDLEVDGRLFHETADGLRKQGDIWRDHQLTSMGWRVRRFWVDELAKDLEGCIDRVARDLS